MVSATDLILVLNLVIFVWASPPFPNQKPCLSRVPKVDNEKEERFNIQLNLTLAELKLINIKNMPENHKNLNYEIGCWPKTVPNKQKCKFRNVRLDRKLPMYSNIFRKLRNKLIKCHNWIYAEPAIEDLKTVNSTLRSLKKEVTRGLKKRKKQPLSIRKCKFHRMKCSDAYFATYDLLKNLISFLESFLG